MLVLASRSPRRRAILEQLGIEFRVVVPDVDELEDGDPRELVLENARRKARTVAEADPARPVLGVDTAVVVAGRARGKPADVAEAEELLRTLSGREHEVLSGVVLLADDGERADVASTRVRFRELDERTIAWYLATGEWRDVAGGYAIQGQGAALIEAIEGDYTNVVGLPVPLLVRLSPALLHGT
jgi:septum formation protein